MPSSRRPIGIRPSGKTKVDFLIPVVQDSTGQKHPHTAYQEWNTLLFLSGIDRPTLAGIERGSEEWGKAAEKSCHWWVVIPRRKVQELLRLLRDDARRIFDQRWIIAWAGGVVYEIGDTVRTKGRLKK